MVSGSVVVGETPVGITDQYQHLRVSSDRLHKRQTKAAGNLINEALSALPIDYWGVIFLQIMSGQIGIAGSRLWESKQL